MAAVEDVEQRLLDVLNLSLLAPRQLERHDPRQPQRLIRMRQCGINLARLTRKSATEAQ